MGREALIMVAWLAGGGATVALLWGIWWAIFADRSRGAFRCPRCWHLIAPGAASPCPECGRNFSGERELLRTRRRWPVALACLALLLAGTLQLRVRLTESGWWRLVPERALIAIVPWLGDGEDASMARGHLRTLLMRGEMSDANAVRMLTLLREGDDAARPGTDAWRRRYGPWLDVLRGPGFWNRYGEAEGPRTVAMSIAPVVTLLAPHSPVAGDGVVLVADVDDCLPETSSLELEVLDAPGLPLEPAALEALRGRRWRRPEGSGSGGFSIPIGPLPVGKHQGALRMRWRAADGRATPGSTAGGEVLPPLDLEVLAQAPSMQPVRDDFVDERVRDAFRPGLLRQSGADEARFAFSYRPMETAGSSVRDIAFGFVVEACEAGVPRRTLHVWWRGDEHGQLGWNLVQEDREALARAQNSPEWTLRVRGDEALARRAGAGSAAGPGRFWAGEVTLPLRVEDIEPGRLMRRWRVVEASPGRPSASR